MSTNITPPVSVSESLSALIVLEVDVASGVVQTVLHRHRLLHKRPDLQQSPTLNHLLGVENVESEA